jgi:hypothetical protein
MSYRCKLHSKTILAYEGLFLGTSQDKEFRASRAHERCIAFVLLAINQDPIGYWVPHFFKPHRMQRAFPVALGDTRSFKNMYHYIKPHVDLVTVTNNGLAIIYSMNFATRSYTMHVLLPSLESNELMSVLSVHQFPMISADGRMKCPEKG